MYMRRCDRCGHRITRGSDHHYENGKHILFPYTETDSHGITNYAEDAVLLCDGCTEEFWLSWFVACGATQPEHVKRLYQLDQ